MFEFGVKPKYLWLGCCRFTSKVAGVGLDVFNGGEALIGTLAVYVCDGFGDCGDDRGRFKEDGGIVDNVEEEQGKEEPGDGGADGGEVRMMAVLSVDSYGGGCH